MVRSSNKSLIMKDNILSYTLIILLLMFGVYSSLSPHQSQAATASESLDTNKESAPELSLSREELSWLKAHPNIQLGASTSYPPLVIKNAKGAHTGMLVDLFELISQRLNTNIGLHIEDSWASIQEKAKNRKIDGLASGGRSASREEYLNSTDVLYSTYYYIFARTNDELHLKSVKDLEGMRIGYKVADTPVKSLLDRYTDVTPVPYDDNVAMTKGLMNKEVDVLIAWISYDFWRRDKLQGSVDNILLAVDNPLDMYIHIRKDWPELIPILNKVLSSIRQNELPKIMDKWFIQRSPLPTIPKIHLTKKEQAWLALNQTVRVRVTDYPPYIIPNKDGESAGIAIDYLKLLGERTGVKFIYQTSDETFPQALKGLQKHKGPDLISAMVATLDRRKSIIFSREYFNSPYMIFMRADSDQIIIGINDLSEKKIALAQGTIQQELLERDYPNISLLLFDNDIQAIEAVASQDADAYIGNMILASYIILNRRSYNLKIAAPCPFEDERYSMGIRNDWPELAGIIDKGLATITPEEQDKIRNRYISLRYDQSNKAEIIKWVLVIVGIGSTILLLFFYWNRSLSRKVKERTISLEKSKKSLETEIIVRKQAEEKIRESEIDLKKAQQVSHVGNWTWNIHSNQLEWSDEMYRIFNIDKDTFVGKLDEVINQRIHPDDKAKVESSNLSVIENKNPIPLEYRVVWADGTVRSLWAEAGELILDDSGKPAILTGIVQDITDRKQTEEKIKASLKEKETLLHEIHHRVKNNMNVISSLLNLQANNIEDGRTKKILKESQSRIFAMSAIHETLHGSENLSEIDLKKYLFKITTSIFQSSSIDPKKVKLKSDIEKMPISINQASPLGLTINELITNSLKYAFPDERKGEITVTMNKLDQELELTVMDDGIGISEEIDWKNSDTLGLKLVRTLVENQLDGSIDMESNNGTKFTIKFNIET